MADETSTFQDRLQSILKRDQSTATSVNRDSEVDGGEESCAAFGFLRGLREQANALELRFRNGNSQFFPYSSMGSWKHNPSEGLLLKFTGDLVYVVLIRGSNLDQRLNENAIDLIRGGLQRHRILWLREMSKDEIKRVGETGPTIDSIEVAEFDSPAALKDWINKKAPAFAI